MADFYSEIKRFLLELVRVSRKRIYNCYSVSKVHVNNVEKKENLVEIELSID